VNDRFNEWNQALYSDYLLMELSDGSGFNANMHPPLLPWELRVPGGHNNYPSDRQVFLKDLQVRFENNDSSLYLWHTKWKKKVFTFDLSLESFYRRSNFYQLLAHFNNEYRILMRHFNAWLDKIIQPQSTTCNDEIIRKPRIVFDNDVIIRRSGWVIPCHKIPIQQKTETEAAWFVRLNKWRMESGISEHVFLYLQSPYLPVGEKKAKPMRDDHKPQYIHFSNPLLTGVFKKMVSRSEVIYIEEMLPHINYLENCKDEPPVTECLVHWYQF
jgi:lantibiotic biosynthesis protein